MERIGVREAVAALRQELSASILAGAGEALRFEVGQVELQFQVEIERAVEGSGGLRFWVVELGAKATRSSSTTHQITIPLRPVTADGQPVLTGSSKVPS